MGTKISNIQTCYFRYDNEKNKFKSKKSWKCVKVFEILFGTWNTKYFSHTEKKSISEIESMN